MHLAAETARKNAWRAGRTSPRIYLIARFSPLSLGKNGPISLAAATAFRRAPETRRNGDEQSLFIG